MTRRAGARLVGKPEGYVLLLLALITCAVAVVGLRGLQPSAPPGTGRKAPAVAEAVGVQAAFVGDSYIGGSAMGGVDRKNFSDIVAQRLNWFRVNLGIGGTGYLAGGGAGVNGQFNGRLRMEQVAHYRPDVLFVVNGVNDLKAAFDAKGDAARADVYAQIRRSATQAFEGYKAEDPTATLVVIGYIAPRTDQLDLFREGNEQLRRAATGAGATFWDPLAEGWFSGENQRLIGGDQFHPTDAGHAYLADLVLAHIRASGLDHLVHRT